ncbi:MAG: hypothetical protein SWX82_32995 [Cyanobacteriota bacterium]|nr:hypothetical protein [Cyanobacteriota bacterium]
MDQHTRQRIIVDLAIATTPGTIFHTIGVVSVGGEIVASVCSNKNI